MSEQKDRLPPFSREAERGVLGSMIRDNDVIDDVVLIIKEAHFYADAHQKLYRGIVALHEKQHPVDLVTLGAWIIAEKYVEDIGGYAYLAELWEAAPTAANAEYYARIVHDRHVDREWLHAAAEVTRNVYERNGSAQDLADSAGQIFLKVGEALPASRLLTFDAVIRDTLASIDRRAAKAETDAVLSGLIDLDALTGGLHDGELTVLAARTSVGKTALALAFACNAARTGKPVYFVSLEQSHEELGTRILCAASGVDGMRIRRGATTRDDVAAIMEAAERLKSLPISVDDTPGQTVLRVAANARRLRRRQNIRLMVVDYLQLLDPGNRRDTREQQVAVISRQLKLLARELNIPVVALAQLNREAKDNERPRLSHLRDSGALEQDADCVFLLWLPEGTESNQVELIVAKQRNGALGDVKLIFNRDCMRFENYAPEVGNRW
jgi:replicative DNA helicase